MRGLQAIRTAYPLAQIFVHPHARDFIVATQDRWLTRRVKMVPSIRRAVTEALNKQQDLSGRPLIPEEREWLENGLASTDQLDRENQGTTGDVVMWLPREGILATGDIVTGPIPTHAERLHA